MLLRNFGINSRGQAFYNVVEYLLKRLEFLVRQSIKIDYGGDLSSLLYMTLVVEKTAGLASRNFVFNIKSLFET